MWRGSSTGPENIQMDDFSKSNQANFLSQSQRFFTRVQVRVENILPEKQQVVLSLVGRATPETRVEKKMLEACKGFPWAGSDWDETRKALLGKHQGDVKAAAAEFAEQLVKTGGNGESQAQKSTTDNGKETGLESEQREEQGSPGGTGGVESR